MSFTTEKEISRLGKVNRNGRAVGRTDEEKIEETKDTPSRLRESLAQVTDRLSLISKQTDIAMTQDNPQLFAVYLVGLHLQQLRSPSILAQEVIRILETNLGYVQSAILLVDSEEYQLRPFALSKKAYGADFLQASEAYASRHELALGKGIAGRVAQSGQTICLGDLRDESPDLEGSETVSSVICVPIRIGGAVIGVINVESAFANAFSDPDRQVLETVSGQLAVAFQNAHLIAQTRRELERRNISSGQTGNEQDLLVVDEVALTADLETGTRIRAIVKELRAQNEELNAFNHTVAHDLKNPLSILLGFSEVLVQDYGAGRDEVLEQAVKVIMENGRRMENIINELLLLAEVRQLDEVEIEPLDTTSIIVETRKRLSNLISDYGATIRVTANWPTAVGHRPWVEEIWVNYLSNAIKYGGTPPEVELGADEQPDGMVRFWVRDNGTGISVADQARLFVPFTKLQQANTKGHGLGLSIVQRITVKLGGQVGVESKTGGFSLFWFTLPAANARTS
jgi:signal transduction histidine kinase